MNERMQFLRDNLCGDAKYVTPNENKKREFHENYLAAIRDVFEESNLECPEDENEMTALFENFIKNKSYLNIRYTSLEREALVARALTTEEGQQKIKDVMEFKGCEILESYINYGCSKEHFPQNP